MSDLRISLLSIAVLLLGALPATAGKVASDWAVGHKSKARLIVGMMPGEPGAAGLYAGLEIVMEPDWKTYWRSPGDAGGVPPYFDWSKSVNVKSTRVMFPAPYRFSDPAGDAIGYKERVVFPVEIEPVSGDDMQLAVRFEYGVCREICIPAQAKLALNLRPAEVQVMPPQLQDAIERVPASSNQSRTELPQLMNVDSKLTGNAPAISLDVRHPDGSQGADLFVEAGSDVYLPMTQKSGSVGKNTVRYVIDLSDGIDIASLRGRMLRLTMTGASGAAEATHKLP